MKKVFSSDNTIDAGLFSQILEDNGIPCLVKNQNLSGALGEIPPLECWPEIWVTRDEDQPRALAIVADLVNISAANHEPWRCSCGETIEGQFDACWNCTGTRPLD